MFWCSLPIDPSLILQPRCDYESKVAVQLFYRIKAKQQRCKKKKEGDHKNSHDDHACHAQSTHGENTHNSSSNPSVSGDTNDKNGNKSNDNCNEGYKDDNKTSMVDSVCAVDSKPGNENSDAYREFVLAERKKRRALAKQKRKDKKLKRRENNLKRERDIQEKEEKFRMQIQQRQQQSRDRQAQGLSQGDVQSEPQTLGRGSDGNATDKAVEKDENCANSRHAVNDCAESKKDHRNDGDRNSSENGNDIDNGKSNDIGNDHSNGHSNKCGESDLDEGYRRAGDVPRRANDSLKRKRAEEGEGQEEEDEGIVISFEEYGMTITKRYASPAELADAIIQNIPRTITLQSSTASTLLLSAAASASSSPPSSVSSSPSSSSPSSSSSSSSFRMEGLIGDIRVLQPTGVLLIVTRPYLEQQRIQGQLYCDLCGQFFDGKMGLREHTQTKHRTNYQTAIQTVERNLQQMVVYSKWMDPYLAYVAKQQPLREKDDKNTSASDGIHTTGDGRSSAGDDSQNGSVDADKQKTRQGLQLAREGRLAELRDFIQANQWDPAHPVRN